MDNLYKDLLSLANKCDESGLYKEAEELEEIFKKLAQASRGEPVGDPVQSGGKMLQKYRQPDGTEVFYPVEPVKPKHQETEEEDPSVFEKYNPFAGLMSGLGSDGEEAARQQAKSELPYLNPASDQTKQAGFSALDYAQRDLDIKEEQQLAQMIMSAAQRRSSNEGISKPMLDEFFEDALSVAKRVIAEFVEDMDTFNSEVDLGDEEQYTNDADSPYTTDPDPNKSAESMATVGRDKAIGALDLAEQQILAANKFLTYELKNQSSTDSFYRGAQEHMSKALSETRSARLSLTGHGGSFHMGVKNHPDELI